MDLPVSEGGKWEAHYLIPQNIVAVLDSGIW